MIAKIINTILLFLPSYIANSSPVVLGGGPPVDGGALWTDGKPILGANKTIRGTITGVLAGTIIGILQGNFLGGFAQSAGALLGDLISSFYKRRRDYPPGSSMPVIDQLDFIIMAVALSYPFQSTDLVSALTIMVITVPIHYGTNYVAWLLKLKKNPW
ncbi:CDP-2,3-bis-(O-geranylgeranyl)-sn-glycerol synthase [Candidatus Bathyarchaeota archaeon]|nr:CDP-2,3-bis-(O-geranylgeranyl)-sn-glycerol synthase [Candidatus Bathyarchaeota archaeon]MBT3284637.1 CDP-2,3-bis-(O-geranylgeranyl)-sn-glycerol synthase [Candidatus Bathyarchaeota archaeon]MBT4321027.1 CDP-2,3-bis-(O-geranylgeranyl)-sn-glycerol synthase [Candidatus Bathyarchaeota archaeon]MBT4425093.1 CDP-2,3-bis-(O-geranylgeranyl)-sn-glycerol synthase [Candidatus Bathyarchaeota archaeon]MBT5641906.1 CDP-2,3-bis-(O-geranylgeranyl)-sn-glycerol synthase [Candidatus Bathyarchaeota archaeon]